jgi:hypothetical protein
MWTAFWPSAVATPAAFAQQIDLLCRELGDRGKPKRAPPALTSGRHQRSEGVPPPSSGGKAPTALDSALTSAATEKPAANPAAADGLGASAGTVIELIMGELKEARGQMQRQSERLEDALRPAVPQPIVTPEQVEHAQSRIAALFGAELLSQDETYALEDAVADFLELNAVVGVISHEMVFANDSGHGGTPAKRFAAAATVLAVVSLSEGIPSDSALARQLRRKVCE